MGAGLPSTSDLQFKSFDTLVGDLTKRWGGATGTTPNLTSGNVALALFQTFATQLVYFEFLLQAVIAMARLSTSTGADVDSFVADYGLTRLPPTFAEGPVTLSTLTPAPQQLLIPVGTIVQSQGGAVQYQLIADTDNPDYSAAFDAYLIRAGDSSATATAKALLSGASQNVQAGILTQLAQGGTGIAIVTNASPIQNGKDAETDEQLRQRFVQYLASLSEATKAAILYAINSVQQGLDVNLLDNTNPAGAFQPGFFTAVVEDGSGSLPSDLRLELINAIDLVRAFTIEFDVVAPEVVNPTAALVVRIAPGSNPATVLQNVKTALLDYVNGLTIGAILYVYRLVQVAEDTDGVIAVKPGTVFIDGEEEDLVTTNFQVVRLLAGDLTVGAV